LGSPIAAACNVLAFSVAEREGLGVSFGAYLLRALPLVLMNGLVTYLLISWRYL
jgi:Na+/H+ antiporter NhaD/arsenite permease-like protein